MSDWDVSQIFQKVVLFFIILCRSYSLSLLLTLLEMHEVGSNHCDVCLLLSPEKTKSNSFCSPVYSA